MHQDLAEICELGLYSLTAFRRLSSLFSRYCSICLLMMLRFRGVYLGQDVAIKIVRSEHLNDALENEFAQEVAILK